MRQPRPRLLSPPFLPEELLGEILLRLPARSLLQFKCVCKSWKTLISSPQFVKDHLRISISNTSTTHQQLAYFTGHERFKMETCSVQSLIENPSAPPETLSFMVNPKYRFIVGSCNGLLCLCDNDGCFRLINPCTRLESNISPFIGLIGLIGVGLIGVLYPVVKHYGFGYDQVNDKYKVIIFCKDVTKLHTFGSNSWTTIYSWTTIQYTPRNLEFYDKGMEGKLVNGTLNWLAIKRGRSIKPVIISFNLEKETYGQVLLPRRVDGEHVNNYALGVLRNCLCLSYSTGTHCVVWLMKKYGIQESWIKLKSIPYAKFFITKGIDPCVTVRPLCISENGVILAKSRVLNLFMYDPNIGTFDYPKINEVMHIYHGSLVSPADI